MRSKFLGKSKKQWNGWALCRRTTMETKIDIDKKIIEKIETGEMFTERSLRWVKELVLLGFIGLLVA